MAYLAQDDKLLNQQNQDPNQQQMQSQMAAPMIGGSSTDVGGGAVSTAGVGAGGTGGWTNIQSYLKANQGDTGSAKNLDDTVGGQYQKESDQIKNDSSKFVSDAQDQANKSKVTTDDAGKLLQEASQNYNWGGQQGDAYNNAVGKVKTGLTAEYSGPREYNYGISSQSQDYNAALVDRGGFDKLMTDIYSNRAGSPLSGGQYQLQKQLDVNNAALDQTRQNLLQRYAGLVGERDNAVADTTGKLSGIEQDFRTNQNALKDYLNNDFTSTDQSIASQEAAAKDAINRLYNSGSGQSSIGWDNLNSSDAPDFIRANSINKRLAANTWNQNQTYRGLANEENIWNNRTNPANIGKMPIYIDTNVGGVHGYDEVNRDAAAKQAILDSFWQQQDQNYGQTADADKKRWNAIAEILGNADRKTQGYNVKGAV
jgi:hypothetical protein